MTLQPVIWFLSISKNVTEDNQDHNEEYEDDKRGDDDFLQTENIIPTYN